MVNIADPVTRWAFLILVSVVMGTGLLIAVAFIRRWQQIRYSRYIHTLQRRYRPMLATVLSGARNPCGIEALRELPLADMEHLLDPLFTRRKLSERQLVFLQRLMRRTGIDCAVAKANGQWALGGAQVFGPLRIRTGKFTRPCRDALCAAREKHPEPGEVAPSAKLATPGQCPG